jgi:hypothetical protein
MFESIKLLQYTQRVMSAYNKLAEDMFLETQQLSVPTPTVATDGEGAAHVLRESMLA